MSRILQLTTDLLDSNTTGGEQRSYFFSTILGQLGELNSIFLPYFYTPNRSPLKLKYKIYTKILKIDPNLVSFYGSRCRKILKKKDQLDRVKKLISHSDLIIFEHPWIFPFVKEFLSPKNKVIYSSHNVEWQMIEEIAESETDKAMCRGFLKDSELALCESADLVITCSEEDADYFRSESDTQVEVVPNCCKPIENKKMPLFLVVTSSHKPNLVSLINLLDKLPKETPAYIGLIGSVCDFIPQEIFDKFEGKLIPYGVVSDAALSCHYQKCDGIILPIMNGSGTNIKTAEAIHINKPIFATKFAMRGFDYSQCEKRIHVSENLVSLASAISQFCENITDQMDYDPSYTWQSQSGRYTQLIKSILS